MNQNTKGRSRCIVFAFTEATKIINFQTAKRKCVTKGFLINNAISRISVVK